MRPGELLARCARDGYHNSLPASQHRGGPMSAQRPSRIAFTVLCLLSAARPSAADPPGDPVLTLKGHTGGVFHVTYSADGKTLATSSKDHTVRLWDAATGKERFVLAGHKQVVYSSAFSPDGKYLASASGDH